MASYFLISRWLQPTFLVGEVMSVPLAADFALLLALESESSVHMLLVEKAIMDRSRLRKLYI